MTPDNHPDPITEGLGHGAQRAAQIGALATMTTNAVAAQQLKQARAHVAWSRNERTTIMIVITGATGALNGATVEHLLKRVPADLIGLSVRTIGKARHFADRGVRVRHGSYEDPAALRDSFEGVDQVLLVSSNDPHADAVGLHRAGIEAAVQAGARRILYTSPPRPHSHCPSTGVETRRYAFHPGKVEGVPVVIETKTTEMLVSGLFQASLEGPPSRL